MGQVKKRLLAIALALGLWLFGWGLFPHTLNMLSERGTDWVWQLIQTSEPERRIVVVDIDDASLAQEGPWPWTRTTLAALVDRLDAAGVQLKLFDITFADTRENSQEFSLALSAKTQESPSVLGQVFAIRNESVLKIGEPVGALASTGCEPFSMPAQGVIANTPGLHSLAGHITPVIDADGAVRRVPSIICYAGKNYPVLALAGLSALDGREVGFTKGSGWFEPAWSINVPSLGGQQIGADARGLLRVPFGQSRKSYVSISAADVLSGKAPAGLLNGAIVFIGASAFGLSDVVSTALGSTVSGVEVHAQLFSGILDAKVPYSPNAEPWIQALSVLVCAALLCLLTIGKPLKERRRVVLLPFATAMCVTLLFGLHAMALYQWHMYVGWAVPALGTLLVGVMLGASEHARTLQVKELIYKNFTSYIPGPAAAKIALTEPTGEIEAQRILVTVLAADIRNFSAYCEARTPEDSARVLHRFYKTASEIVAAHGGVIEELVGDSLLAVFDGDKDHNGSSQRALLASREIWLRCGEELPNTSGQGLEPMAVGIGIETGMALMGSFGAANRRVHTVLGRTVTSALRLCDMTVDLAYPVLIGPGVASMVQPRLDEPDLLLKPLGSFLLPGMTQSGKIFTFCNLLQASPDPEQDHNGFIKFNDFAA